MTTSGSGKLIPLQQVVNQGYLYINGCGLTATSTTVITVGAGQCRDSTDTTDIVMGGLLYNASGTGGTSNPVSASSTATITSTLSGVGGIDTGTIAVDTLYAIYAIGDSRGFNAGAAIFSASFSGPQMPMGYDVYRYIGTVRTTDPAIFLPFDQVGNGKDRWMYYRTAIATDITNGSDVEWAAVDVSGSIPRANTLGLFRVAFTPTAGDDTVFLRSGDSATDAPQATMSGSVAAVVKTGNLQCPVGSTLASGIDYEVIGSATAINVQGYVDFL